MADPDAALNAWIENYSQQRFLADGEEEAEEPQPPNGDEPKPPEYSLTTSVSVPPPERKQ